MHKICVRMLGVAEEGGALATRQNSQRIAARDHSTTIDFFLNETFLAKSISCIARECHKKLTDHDNPS